MNNYEAPNELEIARAIKNQGTDLELLLKKTTPYVLNLCRKWCRPPIDEFDVAQETLIRISNGLNTYRKEAQFYSWVYTLTYRTFVDQARKNTRRENIAKVVPLNSKKHDLVSADNSNFDSDVETSVHQALESLKGDMRDALLLVDVGGASYEQAAKELGIAIGTVRSRLARARIALRNSLVESGTFSDNGSVLISEDEDEISN